MNASEIIKSIEAEQLKAEVPEFRVGDTVKVYGKIKEGNRERIQVFEGVVIKRQGGSNRETYRPAIKQRSLEALRLQPLGRTSAVCFSMVLDFIQTIRRTLGKHDQLGIANKTRRQPITATLGKLYVVALFISHSHHRHAPTHRSFCRLHDS